MNVPELFIRRPVMTTLVMAGILIFGAISYRFQGRDFRLTDVAGHVVDGILA